MKKIYPLILFSILFWTSCAQKRVTKYQNLLDPMVGSSKKIDVNKKLGGPTFCKFEGDNEVCEYRTTKSHNENIPVHLQKANGFPDLSPYDYYDVLHITYDAFGNFKEWQPVVLAP